MLVATALVLLMTPALGLFYAGLVRGKNTLNTFMMCIAAIAIAAVTWTAIGYSFAFGEANEIIGGFDYALPEGRHVRAARGLDDSPPAVLRLPGDLLHHHRGAGLGRRRGADALRGVHALRRPVVGAGLRRARPLGVRRRAGCSRAARWTSRAASPSRWPRASRPWRRRWWWARARTTGARRCCRTTRCTCCWAPACCGSAGSASTAAAASAPARTACWRSSTRC